MGKRVRLKRKDDRQEPNRAEQVLTFVSVGFTIALFSYVGWHAITTPADTDPTARVAGTRPAPTGDDVVVHVEFMNPGGVGLLMAEVEVNCTTPAPQVTFSNVPAGGGRAATVICPPGTKAPEAKVTSWVEA